LIAADFVAVMLRRRRQLGDFDVSMEFGRRFASGQPLSQGGLHFPYLPTAAMFFAPFSMLPRPLAFLLFYMLAFICLVLVYRRLTAMVCNARPVLRQRRWAVAIVSLILASHYIIRDLDDGGPNIVLLALATGRNLSGSVRTRSCGRWISGRRHRVQGHRGRIHPFPVVEAPPRCCFTRSSP
jgi:hypothetical protein